MPDANRLEQYLFLITRLDKLQFMQHCVEYKEGARLRVGSN